MLRRRKLAGIVALVATALAIVVAPHAVRAHSWSYVFTTLDFPGAAVTQAYGINARGDIVGTYQNADKKNHAFLLKASRWDDDESEHSGVSDRFRTIDFPGGNTDYSIATGIGPAGDIVGYYGVVGGAASSGIGFLRDKHGRWTTVANPVDPTPVMTPSPFRILPDGTMVGCFHYATEKGAYTSMHGFTLTPDGNFSRFDYPAAMPMSMHYGATPDARMIVGVYMVGSVNHGYILTDDGVTTFDVPGSGRTTPQDINAAGVIAGTYRNPDEPPTKLHSFLLETHRSTDQSKWAYTSVPDVAGASITRVRGMNPRGDLVGDYVGSDGKDHGFLARRSWD